MVVNPGAFKIVAVNKQGIRKCPSPEVKVGAGCVTAPRKIHWGAALWPIEFMQQKSATQGTMIVAMQLESKKRGDNFQCTPLIFLLKQ